MNLLDIADGIDITPPTSTAWEPLTRANACIRRDTWVRLKAEGRIGFCLVDEVTATGRVCVCWKPGSASSWHHVSELDPSPAPLEHQHEWIAGMYIWPGETAERMVWRCAGCLEIRGRVK